MKKIITLIYLFAIASSVFFVSPLRVLAQADTSYGLNDTVNKADTSYGLNDTVNKVDAFRGQTFDTNFLQTKTGQIIGLVLSFVGAIFLILMIYAGILWMTAQGNDQQVSKAKSLMIDAVVGMIIVFAAYALTTFLGGQLL